MEKELEVILIEDNISDAELTIRALKKKNLCNQIVHLKDGAEALDFIFAKGEYEGRDMTKTPKVILLDLKMPKIDGIEVLKRIKADDRTRAIPLVILTSSGEDPDIKRCYELGANSYIVKPVDFQCFLEAVTDLGMYWMLVNQPPTTKMKLHK
ncbi:MAG: response regulator [Balneolales bacterium]